MEEWLRTIGLGDRIAAFRAHGIAADQLADLTEDDLRELGLTIGERKRFRRALESASGRPPEAARAERRPLTMMFVDMAGSSRLSELLDPEDQMELLQAYRAFCGGVIERFGGHIARVVGDGILAYFCYPVANENDPERAVRAALQIARDAGGVATPSRAKALGPIQVRVGVATGRVIVSDLFAGSREADRNSIIGATPNLAARLQALAPPGGVVAADETHARVRHLFACEDLGERRMHGFDAAHRAWRIVGDLPPHARTFAPPRPQRLTPCFGRAVEQARIAERWERAKAGGGGAMLLIGEAGIGKSRLIEDFLARTLPEGAGVVQLAASAFDQDSALHPATAFLRAAAGMAADDPARVKHGKLAAVLFGDAAERARAAPVLARLLDVPALEGEPYEALAPEQLRERTLSVLARQMCVRAESRPLCVVVEDLHWLDPTSLELVARLTEAAARLPLLLLATAREGFEAPWLAEPHVTTLRLERLGADDVAGMVTSLFAGQEPPPHVAKLIARRTDGIPLFVEEVARSLLQAQEAGGALPDPAALDEPDGAIPASLHEALMARLDRSGAAKQVAQVAAVVGRTVRRRVLAAVAQLPAAEMEEALRGLTEAGVLFRDDAAGAEAYTFGHALMRDAAYDTLLRDHRRLLHLTVARALPELDADAIASQPEALAFHLTEAGEADEAAAHWEAAATRSLARSALAEATRLLRRGIDGLRALEATPERLRLRLGLETLLGPALIALHGTASPEAGELYEGALAACRELPDDPAHFPFYWGSWLIAPKPSDKRDRARVLLERAQAMGEPDLLLEAHHCGWASAFLTGDLDACCAHAGAGLDVYHSGDFADHARKYANHDPKVCAHSLRGLVLWMRGRPRAAAAEHAAATDWAIASGHLGSEMHAREAELMLHAFQRDFAGVLKLSDAMGELAEAHALKAAQAEARIFRGWATAMTTEPQAGLAVLEEGLGRLLDLSVPLGDPLWACMRAEALAAAGRLAQADEVLARETGQSVASGMRVLLPELLRTRAEVILSGASSKAAQAAGLLEEAARVADEQGAAMLSLRVAVAASRIDLREGDRAAAARRVATALRAVPDDDSDADLTQARRLLKAWGGGVFEPALADR